MQTRLIRTVPDSIGWGEWVWEKAKEHPGKAAGLVVAAPFALPLELTAVVGGLLIGGVTALAVGTAGEYFRNPEEIQKVELKSAGQYVDGEGAPLVVNKNYAFHPNTIKSNTVYPVDIFHTAMIAEQVADLVSYIRSVVRATEIKVAVVSETGLGVKVDLPVSSEVVGLKAHAGAARHHSIDLKYDNPEIVPLGTIPFWMRVFPEIVAAFSGARGGSVKRSQAVDTSFGLSMSVAKVAGIDTAWLGKQRFEVEAIF